MLNIKNELLYDFITGEIYECEPKVMKTLLQEIREEYQDQDIVVGRDNFFNTNVWFINEIHNSISRLELETRVAKYLGKEV